MNKKRSKEWNNTASWATSQALKDRMLALKKRPSTRNRPMAMSSSPENKLNLPKLKVRFIKELHSSEAALKTKTKSLNLPPSSRKMLNKSWCKRLKREAFKNKSSICLIKEPIISASPKMKNVLNWTNWIFHHSKKWETSTMRLRIFTILKIKPSVDRMVEVNFRIIRIRTYEEVYIIFIRSKKCV